MGPTVTPPGPHSAPWQAKGVNYGPDSRLELHTSFPEMHIAIIFLATLKTKQILGFYKYEIFLDVGAL